MDILFSYIFLIFLPGFEQVDHIKGRRILEYSRMESTVFFCTKEPGIFFNNGRFWKAGICVKFSRYYRGIWSKHFIINTKNVILEAKNAKFLLEYEILLNSIRQKIEERAACMIFEISSRLAITTNWFHFDGNFSLKSRAEMTWIWDEMSILIDSVER